MRAFLLATAAAFAPSFALAQVVPALQADSASSAVPGMASASATATAPAFAAAPQTPGDQTAPAIPPGMPPGVRVLSPSAPLTVKERRGVALAARWAGARYMPQPGADGVVRFPYGATLPTVVCAPLQVCDIRLQPGEVVNNINAGDKVRWSIMPGLSGSPEGQVTHLLVKPVDAGLVSSVTVLTDRRAYSIKLVSTQAQWMPHVGFTYPDEQQQAWGAYQQAVGVGAAYGGGAGAGGFGAPGGLSAPGGGSLSFYDIRCDGSPTWTPRRAWTDGVKTYVEFAGPLNSGAPAFVGLGSGGGWFSRPPVQVVNYRPVPGNRYVADAALDRAALIAGVGGDEQRCTLTREARR